MRKEKEKAVEQRNDDDADYNDNETVQVPAKHVSLKK